MESPMSTSSDPTRAATPTKCRACNRPMNSPLVCDSCRTLYPAEGANYFELLGLAPHYDLDDAALRRRYLDVSRNAHPDQQPTDATLSMRASAQLNEAYRVLSDPVLRAGYLLELHGGRSAAEDKSVPQEVLNQTLLLREDLAEAQAAGDVDRVARIQDQIRALREQSANEAARLAQQLPGDAATRQSLREALNALKYYDKLDDGV